MPQPTKPLKPAEIIDRRRAFVPPQPLVSGMPTSQPTTLFTISTPPPPPVVTIVCWNVVTFTEGKAQTNPYVNVVIRNLLAALDADVCVLLETHDHPSINLAMIEHRVANPTSYKVDGQLEEEWELKELEAERVEHLKALGTPTQVVTTYETLASDLTGKIWRPPRHIYLYAYVEQKIAEAKEKHEKYNEHTRRAKKYRKTAKKREEQAKEASALNKKKEAAKKKKSAKHYRELSKEYVRKAKKYVKFKDAPKKPFIEANLQKGYSGGNWKLLYQAHEILQIYYAPCQRSTKQEITNLSLVPNDANSEADVELRLRRCPDCNAYLGDATDCDRCADLGPYSTALANLWETFTANASQGKGAVQLETYAALIKPNSTDWGRPDGLIQLTGKAAGVQRFGCRLLRYKPTPLLSNDARFELLQRELKVPDTGDVDEDTKEALGQFLKSKGVAVSQISINDAIGMAMTYLAIPTHEPPTGELGYGVQTSKFYGRSPLLVPLLLRPAGATQDLRVPLVAFHAPYGKSDSSGLDARMRSLAEAMDADVGDPDGRSFADVDAGILIGDLNLDLAATSGQKATYAQRAYTALAGKNYDYMIPRVPSSLVTLKSIQTTTSGTVERYTSSAYDNVLLKGGDLQRNTVTAAVIDVIGWLEDNLPSLDLAPAVKAWGGFSGLTNQQKAAWIYRKFVSDHLPIVLDIAVEPPGGDFDARTRQYAQSLKVKWWRETVRFVELTYDSVEIVTLCPPGQGLQYESSAAALYVGLLQDVANDGSVTVDFGGGTSTTLPKPAHGYHGKLGPGEPVAVIVDKPGLFRQAGTHAVISCVPWASIVQPIDMGTGGGQTVFIIGRVTRLSGDKQRLRVAAGDYRCTLPIPDTEKDLRPGDSVMAVVSKPQLEPVVVKR